MHLLEPHYNWRNIYRAEDDENSPFYGREYSEFYFENSIYNYYIHPQWDEFGSATLYTKILYADYIQEYAILELIGEWNDVLYNDIKFFKREVIEVLQDAGIKHFILIGENILNAFPQDDDYYAEWAEEVEDGYICCINFREHVLKEFQRYGLSPYLHWGGELDNLNWRTLTPPNLFKKISDIVQHRLG